VSERPPEVEQSQGKSRILAVGLALALGPLGLLYVRAWGTAVLLLLIAIPFLLNRTGGLWLPIGGRILCAVLAYYFAVELNKTSDSDRDSGRLLDEAARLESVDREKAIAAYEEIVRLYPNTSAGKEAARNIQTLKQSG
jgi:hypothetical protein